MELKRILPSEKRGIALNQAFGAVLTLVLVATLIVIAIYLFVTLSATFVDLESETTLNETIGPVTEVGVATANHTKCNFEDFTVLSVANATSGTVITTANYSADSATGVLVYTGEADNLEGFNNSNWNITYTYNWGGESCEAADEMVENFSDFPVLIGLVGTIIFLGLVIGILVAAFVFGGRKGTV